MVLSSIMEPTALRSAYKAAAQWVKNRHRESDLRQDVRLQLYGLYKRIHTGSCDIDQPDWDDSQALALYSSWKLHEQVSKDDAMTLYVDLVRNHLPGFEEEYLRRVPSNSSITETTRLAVKETLVVPQAAAAATAGPVTAAGETTAATVVQEESDRLIDRTHSRPVHKSSKVSWLSPGSPVESFDGFINLFMLLVGVANVKLLFQKLRSGLEPARMGLFGINISIPDEWPCVLCGVGLASFFLAALAIERAALKKQLTEATTKALNGVNCALSLLLPCYVAWRQPNNTLTAVALLFFTIITSLKIISYSACNTDLRKNHHSRQTQDDNAKPLATCQQQDYYPANLTVKDVAYFAFAPTLCYQPHYPCTTGIRPRVISSLLLQLVLVGLALALVVMSMQPTVARTLVYVHEKLQSSPMLTWTQRWLYRTLHVVDFYTVEKLLSLAIPCTCAWVLMFYMYFHLGLNLMAELLCFADREFYKDWWNASTLFKYWRTWNMPVHAWLMRHVYFPAMRAGLSRTGAAALVFTLSAFFHELIVAGYAFFAMLFQVPLCMLTDLLDRHVFKPLAFKRAGNMLFWCIFCIFGQPLIVLLITWDLYVRREGLPGVVAPN